MLRVFGAKIGKNVHIYPSVKIFIPWNLRIGDYSSIGDWAIIYNLAEVVLGLEVDIRGEEIEVVLGFSQSAKLGLSGVATGTIVRTENSLEEDPGLAEVEGSVSVSSIPEVGS